MSTTVKPRSPSARNPFVRGAAKRESERLTLTQSLSQQHFTPPSSSKGLDNTPTIIEEDEVILKDLSKVKINDTNDDSDDDIAVVDENPLSRSSPRQDILIISDASDTTDAESKALRSSLIANKAFAQRRSFIMDQLEEFKQVDSDLPIEPAITDDSITNALENTLKPPPSPTKSEQEYDSSYSPPSPTKSSMYEGDSFRDSESGIFSGSGPGTGTGTIPVDWTIDSKLPDTIYTQLAIQYYIKRDIYRNKIYYDWNIRWHSTNIEIVNKYHSAIKENNMNSIQDIEAIYKNCALCKDTTTPTTTPTTTTTATANNNNNNNNTVFHSASYIPTILKYIKLGQSIDQSDLASKLYTALPDETYTLSSIPSVYYYIYKAIDIKIKNTPVNEGDKYITHRNESPIHGFDKGVIILTGWLGKPYITFFVVLCVMCIQFMYYVCSIYMYTTSKSLIIMTFSQYYLLYR